MSDGNTNSTLLSDDTDDRSRTVLLEMGMPKQQEFDVRVSNMRPFFLSWKCSCGRFFVSALFTCVSLFLIP